MKSANLYKMRISSSPITKLEVHNNYLIGLYRSYKLTFKDDENAIFAKPNYCWPLQLAGDLNILVQLSTIIDVNWLYVNYIYLYTFVITV